LKVDKDLYIKNSPLAKLSDSDLFKMIGSDGFIKGEIKR